MKIFIVHVSAGAGHFKAAEAVYRHLKLKAEDLDLRLIDVLEDVHPLFKKIYTFGYTFLVRYASWFWRFLFYSTSIKFLEGKTKFLHDRLNRQVVKSFTATLIKENPDFIISTHFLPSSISANLRDQGKITSQVISIITDFGVHPFWVTKGTDLYIVATEFTKQQLAQKGVGLNAIKVLGIPVDDKFLKLHEKALLCKKLGIKEGLFTVLIVTGSFGIGPIEKIVDALCDEAQILVVCARNKNLLKKLKGKDYPAVKIFGFIDNIDELMAVSDVIITKPGGLTISEILTMELAPIFIAAIPGQETENAAILEKYGIGLNIETVDKIKETILDYKHHPEKLIEIKNQIRSLKKTDTIEELYHVICAGGIRPSP